MATRISVLLLAVMSVAGCGGGGGSSTPAPTPDAFAGIWHVSGYEGSVGPPVTAFGRWGAWTVDGLGMVTGGSLSTNSNGTLLGSTATAPFGYTLDATTGDLTMSGSPVLQGRLAATGNIAITAQVSSGMNPGLVVMTRRAGSFTTASLVGAYHIGIVGYTASVAADSVLWGTATFDGAGLVAYTVTQNANGAILGPATASGTYSVAADGTLTIGFGPQTMSGGLLASGDVAFVSGGTGTGNAVLLAVLIRQSTTATLSTFQGTYQGCLVLAPNTSGGIPHWTVGDIRYMADGVGGVSASGATLNQDGTVSTSSGGGSPQPYTVGANGFMTWVAGLGLGAVSPTGDVAFLAGGPTPSSTPVFLVLAR